MDEGRRREADVSVLEFGVKGLQRSLAGEEVSESERKVRLRTGLLEMLRDLPPPTPYNYVEHEYLCDTYEDVDDETAPVVERCHVKMLSVLIALIASVDQWLPLEERRNRFDNARRKLAEARQFLATGECEELRAAPRAELSRSAQSLACLHPPRWTELHFLDEVAVGLEEGDITTNARFDVPLVLPVPDGQYDIRFDNAIAHLKVVYRPPPATRGGTVVSGPGVGVGVLPGDPLQWLELPQADHINKVEMLAAKRATVGFTSVVATFRGYINPYYFEQKDLAPDIDPTSEEAIREYLAAFWERSQAPVRDPERGPSLGEHRSSALLQAAVRLLNRFIDEIRLSGSRFDIERLLPADIADAFATVVLVRGNLLFSAFESNPGPLLIRGKLAAPKWFDEFRGKLLSEQEPPIERFLMLDARKFLFQGELRLSVLNVNTAFEAFLNRHFVERLADIATKEEIEAFLRGESVFELCKAELVKRAEGGDESARAAVEVLPLLPVRAQDRFKPTVYRMIGEMNRRLAFGLSSKKRGELINRIRRRRNEVAHGQFGDADLDPNDVQDSIDALEEFIRIAVDTLDAQRTRRRGGEPADVG